jgi:hypothetical protein
MRKQHTLTSRTKETDPSKAYGLDMIITFENKNSQILERSVIIRHREKQFYSLILKSFVMNPDAKEIRKQFDNMWLILGSGGTPEDPASYIVTSVRNLPDYCFESENYKNNKNRIAVHFKRAVPWRSSKYQTLLGDTIFTEIAKLREEI